jgi:hypothetical protein
LHDRKCRSAAPQRVPGRPAGARRGVGWGVGLARRPCEEPTKWRRRYRAIESGPPVRAAASLLPHCRAALPDRFARAGGQLPTPPVRGWRPCCPRRRPPAAPCRRDSASADSRTAATSRCLGDHLSLLQQGDDQAHAVARILARRIGQAERVERPVAPVARNADPWVGRSTTKLRRSYRAYRQLSVR